MPRKPPQVFDRDREWEALSEIWESDRPELVFVLGRRRVGKSFTLAPFARAVRGLYYQGTRRTEADQLRSLTARLADRFSDAALRRTVLESWEDVFGYLLERVGEHPFLFVIDEFPYLDAVSPALPSVLQSLVDHDLRDSRMKLVLSGSHITAMRRLEAADQPLYARRTRRIDFAPFTHLDAARFVSGYDALDRLRTYAVFGGTAGHLALVDPEADLATNVQRQVLDPGARLYDEAQRMLDAFLSDAAVHYSILQAIANGERTWSGITKRIGKPAGSVSRPMAWLAEMQIVRRDVPITVANPERTKRAVYVLTDPYVAFWHRFVAPLIAVGSLQTTSPSAVWKRNVQPRLDEHVAGVFEEVCRQATRLGDIVPFEVTRVGRWWNADSSEEVDVVALGQDGELCVGECKWGAVKKTDMTKLERRAKLIADELDGVTETHFLLFSATGEAEPAVRLAADQGRVRLVDARDLYDGR